MATISRTGITAGGTISPTHITNIIDALDGTGVGITVVATGSFSGSLVGNATTATSASYAPPTFPYTGSARITGSLAVTGSTSLSGSLDGNLLATNNLIFNLSQLGRTGGSGSFVVPIQPPASPTDGTLYWDSENYVLRIFSAPAGDWAYMQFNV
jgi:hypothetical protein